MKSKTKGKKISLKLDVSPDITFVLIAISSHENDYRLVWAMNNQLNCNFLRTENLVFRPLKAEHDLEFGRFRYTDEERLLTYYLISNRCPDGFLFPEIKNMDFLLQVTGEVNNRNIEGLLRSLNGIKIISGAYRIDHKILKGIGRIVPT